MTSPEILAKRRAWWATYSVANKEAIRRQKKAYRLANIEKVKKDLSDWRAKNIDYHRGYCRDYYRRNKAHIRKRLNAWQEKQRETNPKFRIRQTLSRRIYQAIKKTKRTGRTLDVTGCTVEFLCGWLESRFQPGMSWDNYVRNGWHVDHIIPCSAFDLSDPDQQKQCFHYTNLQPLWAKDNWSKGKSLSHKIERRGYESAINDDYDASIACGSVPEVF